MSLPYVNNSRYRCWGFGLVFFSGKQLDLNIPQNQGPYGSEKVNAGVILLVENSAGLNIRLSLEVFGQLLQKQVKYLVIVIHICVNVQGKEKDSFLPLQGALLQTVFFLSVLSLHLIESW